MIEQMHSACKKFKNEGVFSHLKCSWKYAETTVAFELK